MATRKELTSWLVSGDTGLSKVAADLEATGFAASRASWITAIAALLYAYREQIGIGWSTVAWWMEQILEWLGTQTWAGAKKAYEIIRRLLADVKSKIINAGAEIDDDILDILRGLLPDFSGR